MMVIIFGLCHEAKRKRFKPLAEHVPNKVNRRIYCRTIFRTRNALSCPFKHWPGRWKELSEFEQPYEASTLGLTIDKAKYHLGWKPKWNFSETVQYTMEWYRSFHSGEFNTKSLCQKQIKEFSN